ncbi:acetoacetate metabolism regulatory protein AtoC [Dissulfurispira thermophila]|uniref:DNA-binding transcriptional regulator NtrC n=1 Tax=Dissulfurispira thermophila TaxID=2715679 RepID=A0A7G1H588_9BACT|nr:sigma-54 dependent transcriptional regulator [Dissulfurispira thermophila]BCB97086.1 acetoacetate metabolism regulatory protein AtoC [Dissulfurispira thermophila]
MNKKILIIDDDESVIWVIRKALEPLGYEVEAKTTIKTGIKVVDKFKLILLDLMLPDGSGIDALREIKVFNPDALIIIVTAHGRMETVIDAMKEGAYDYLEKPFDIEELKITTEKAFRDIAMREELLKLRQTKEDTIPFQIIGKSKSMLKVFKEIGKVAPKDVTILIYGESGTGKELVARAIHNNSRRKFGPFIAINSASIPKELMEAELFGWEKGAFTGAIGKTAGKIQAADGGTLFLDEISELDIDLQAKLLRFLQEQEYSPLGSNKIIKADVRIIGATNKDLMQCVKKGTFREDLYYRFNVIEIKLPPLRERNEDILPLAHHFLEKSIKAFELQPKKFSKDAEKALMAYNWPGNARELENTIKKAAILSRGSIIEKKDLFLNDYNMCSIKEFLESKLNGFLNKMAEVEKSNLYDTIMSEVEKALFSMVLQEANGNQVRAAKMLGINRNTLNKKIKEYKLI